MDHFVIPSGGLEDSLGDGGCGLLDGEELLGNLDHLGPEVLTQCLGLWIELVR